MQVVLKAACLISHRGSDKMDKLEVERLSPDSPKFKGWKDELKLVKSENDQLKGRTKR